ncbi:hypothetical protein [Nonomuraea sp. NPDC049158]|uniref:hypothetical protein n=1 Tax=Nonomuraea sp. NPDC049158 TaxID=3155649 RepID=UPI0033D89CCB
MLEVGEASAEPFVSTSGLQAWGIYQWHLGDIGEAYRYLSRSKAVVLDLARRDEDPVRHDLLLIMVGLLAEVTALHGGLDAAREMLDMLERSAGDDPYVRTIWATFAARIAALAGDPVEALRVTELGIAADPGLSFAYLGTDQRLARCWALTRGGYKAFAPHEPRTYAASLEKAGYRTGYLGKYINEYPVTGTDYHVPTGWDEWHVAAGAPDCWTAARL